MKNNTKLIMETWRRFLAEGLDAPMYDPEQGPPTGDPIDPSEETELSGDVPQRNNLPFDDEYNPDGDLDSELAADIERIDSGMDMSGEDFEDLPHAGDDIEYSMADTRMTDEERDAAQEERNALSDPDVDEFGNEQENPFAYDDGPY